MISNSKKDIEIFHKSEDGWLSNLEGIYPELGGICKLSKIKTVIFDCGEPCLQLAEDYTDKQVFEIIDQINRVYQIGVSSGKDRKMQEIRNSIGI